MAASVLLIAVTLAGASVGQTGPDWEIVQVGFDGEAYRYRFQSHGALVRHGKWAPVRVRVTAIRQDFSGVVRVEQDDHDGDKIIAQTPRINVRVGEGSVSTWLYFLPKCNSDRNIDASFRLISIAPDEPDDTKGEVVGDPKQPAQSLIQVDGDDPILLDISANTITAVSALVDPPPDKGDLRRVFQRARCAAVNLPDSVMGLEMIDYIIWDQADPTVLDPRQLDALTQWVLRGGCLVVAGRDTWQELLGSKLGPILPVQGGELVSVVTERDAIGAITREARYPGFKEFVPGSWPTAEDSVAYFEFEPRPDAVPLPAGRAKPNAIFYARPAGHGRVIAVGAPLSELLQKKRLPDLGKDTSSAAAALGTLLGVRREANPLANTYPQDHRVFPKVRAPIDFRGASGARMVLAVLFVAAYVLGATFLSWGWLSRKGWLQHSWTAFAVIAVAASAVSIAGVRLVQGIGIQVHQVSIIDTEAGSTVGRAYVLFGVKTPSHQVLDVWLPKNATDLVTSPPPTDNWLRPLPGPPDSLSQTYAAPYRYRLWPGRAAIFAVPIRATLKQFEGHWTGPLEGQLRASLNVELRQYGGPGDPPGRRGFVTRILDRSWIENRLGVDLTECYLLYGLHAWPGAERLVNRRDDDIFVVRLGPMPASGPGSKIALPGTIYNDANGNPLPPYRWGGHDAPTDRNLMRLHDDGGRTFRAVGAERDFQEGIVILSTLSEQASDDQRNRPTRLLGTHGRHLDRSDLITPGTALFIGFANAPGPVRLKVRTAGRDETRPWTRLDPDDDPASQRTVFRVTIPLTLAPGGRSRSAGMQ